MTRACVQGKHVDHGREHTCTRARHDAREHELCATRASARTYLTTSRNLPVCVTWRASPTHGGCYARHYVCELRTACTFGDAVVAEGINYYTPWCIIVLCVYTSKTRDNKHSAWAARESEQRALRLIVGVACGMRALHDTSAAWTLGVRPSLV